MRVISLLQPYATLLVRSLKRRETRTRNTTFRGYTIVHASLGKPPWTRAAMQDERIIRALQSIGQSSYEELPRGQLLGATEIYATERTNQHNAPWQPEQAFGDYTPGRWQWFTRNSLLLPEPLIRIDGHLGLWTIDDALLPAEFLRTIAMLADPRQWQDAAVLSPECELAPTYMGFNFQAFAPIQEDNQIVQIDVPRALDIRAVYVPIMYSGAWIALRLNGQSVQMPGYGQHLQLTPGDHLEVVAYRLPPLELVRVILSTAAPWQLPPLLRHKMFVVPPSGILAQCRRIAADGLVDVVGMW